MTENQLRYLAHQENVRHNAATEADAIARTSEMARSNLANETEKNRSNLVNESETHRSNLVNESEMHRSNVARETETHRHNTINELQALFNWGIEVGKMAIPLATAAGLA